MKHLLPSSGLKIGRIFGIDIVIHASWLLILVLFTVTFGDIFRLSQANGHAFPAGIWPWLLGFVTSLVLFACLLLHELSHSYIAKRSGININRITLFFLGGVAEMSEDVSTAGTEFRMAIAGPIMSLVLAGIFFLLYMIADAARVGPMLVIPLFSIAGMNLAWSLFNLVPAFPLDGGRVLRSILWKTTGDLRKATRVASVAGQVFAVLLIGAGIYLLIQGYFGGGWFILLGAYVFGLARASYRQTLFRLALADTKVRDIMHTGLPVIDSHTRLTYLRDNYFAAYRLSALPVSEGGSVVGVIHRDDLAGVSPAEWDLLDAGRVVRPLSSIRIVDPETPLDRVMRQVLRGDDFMLVMEGQQVLGMLTREELLRYVDMRLKQPEG